MDNQQLKLLSFNLISRIKYHVTMHLLEVIDSPWDIIESALIAHSLKYTDKNQIFSCTLRDGNTVLIDRVNDTFRFYNNESRRGISIRKLNVGEFAYTTFTDSVFSIDCIPFEFNGMDKYNHAVDEEFWTWAL